MSKKVLKIWKQIKSQQYTFGAILLCSLLIIASVSISFINGKDFNVVDATGFDDWVINGDTVYVDDEYVYLSATPHTLGSSGWVEFELRNKVATQNIDVVWGFNSDCKPKNPQIWKSYDHVVTDWHWVPFDYNVTFYDVTDYTILDYSDYDLYEDVIGAKNNNTKLIDITYGFSEYGNGNSIVAFNSQINDGNNVIFNCGGYHIRSYQHVENFFDWQDFEANWEVVDYNFGGMDRWYLLKNVPVQKDVDYNLRAWIDIPFAGLNDVSGKFWWAIKPSSESLSVAISNNHFYALDPWWSSSWTYYKAIAIPSSFIDSDLTNFPVLVVIDSATGAKCNSGNSIRFVPDSNSSMEYAYQIGEWNAGGTSYVYVNITSVSSTSSTIMNMYYGNAGASDNSSTDTWDSDFVGVYHLNASTTTTGGCYDFTANTNHGTYGGSLPTNVGGKVGVGQDFDGTGDHVSFPQGAFASISGTVDIVLNSDVDGADTDYILQIRGTTDDDRHWMCMDGGATTWTFATIEDGSFICNIAGGVSNTNPHLFSSSYTTGGEVHARVDGASIGIDNDGFTVSPAFGWGSITLGTKYNYANEFDGKMSEFRLSDIGRSDAWMDATYDTLMNNATFLLWGAEQTDAPSPNNAPTTSGEAPVNNSLNTPYTPVDLYVICTDADSDTMNVSWWSNSSGSWKQFGVANASVASGTNITQTGTNFTVPLTTYTWEVRLNDGEEGYTNSTFIFTTVEYTTSINVTDTSLNGSRNITWSGNSGTTAWCNSSGSKQETPDINITINSNDDGTYTDIRFYFADIDATVTADCMNITFSSDNSTWAGDDGTINGTQGTKGGGYFYINSTVWTHANGMYGTDPFTQSSGLPTGWNNIYFRVKLDISSVAPSDTYTTSITAWSAILGYWT